MYKLLVLAGLLTVAAASKNRCPMVFGKYPFDEQRFAGEWKIYAKTSERHAPPLCGAANFQPGKDGTTVTLSGKTMDGKVIHGDVYGQPMFPGVPEKNANLYVVHRRGNGPFSGVFKQSVVATDYENYALLVACKPAFDEATKTFSRELWAKLLYRPDRTLSQDTVNVLSDLLKGYDIDDPLKIVDQSKC